MNTTETPLLWHGVCVRAGVWAGNGKSDQKEECLPFDADAVVRPHVVAPATAHGTDAGGKGKRRRNYGKVTTGMICKHEQ